MTTSPFKYILQAAMGQCSNLPADNRCSASNSHNGSMHLQQGSNQSPRKRYSNGDRSSSQYRSSRRQQRDDNVVDMDTNEWRTSSDNSTTPLTSKKGMGGQKGHNMESMVNVVRQGVDKFEPFMHDDQKSHQQGNMNSSNHGKPPHPIQQPTQNVPERRNPSGSSVAPAPEQYVGNEENIPLPPSSAVRTRCYRLNLETSPLSASNGDDYHSIAAGVSHGQSIGPMVYEPPPHHRSFHPTNTRKSKSWGYSNDRSGLEMSCSDDSSVQSATTVAVTTAKIFRGITVDKNGTILSQNARATRSSRHKNGGAAPQKQGEKSRQAAKIDKAKDLVDEALEGVKEGEEPKNMVSLVIMGEYDEMKHLVRDGSKKLRDAEKLPDEALLAINRPRGSNPQSDSGVFSEPTSPNRKRVSTNLMSTGSSYNSSKNSRHKVPLPSPSGGPPKLKCHPRDRPTTRRVSGHGHGVDNMDENENPARSRRFSHMKDHCSDMPMFGGTNGDWSEALGFSGISIWNCGATGTNSLSPSGNGKYRGENIPTQAAMGYEGRNETNNYDRRRAGGEMRVGESHHAPHQDRMNTGTIFV